MTGGRWIPIARSGGWYDVSDRGRVRSWKSLGPDTTRLAEPRILATAIVGGYVVATLSLDPQRLSQFKVHRLMLEAFVGPCPDGCEARHLDGDRQNNALANVVWGTKKENANDKRRHGTMAEGERSGRAKLSDDDVRAIRSSDEPASVLADRFGITRQNVWRVRKGLSYGSVPRH